MEDLLESKQSYVLERQAAKNVVVLQSIELDVSLVGKGVSVKFLQAVTQSSKLLFFFFTWRGGGGVGGMNG